MSRAIAWTLWNLWLASLPVLFAWRIGRTPPGRLRLGTWLLGAAWLLMLPNTAYLMTEWRHFLFDEPFVRMRIGGQTDRTAMFQTAIFGLLFAGYSAVGAVLFTLAVRPVERVLASRGVRSVLWMPVLFLLVAVGVYIGLFDRMNSWDAVRDPLGVLTRCLRAVSRPAGATAILGFAVVLGIVYLAIGYVIEGAAADWRRLRARRGAANGPTPPDAPGAG
jgi:uncharacterized membrane protein